MGLIYEDSNAFFWRAYSSVNINADGAVITADPDDPSKPLREPNGKLAVRSLSRPVDGQPRFKRYLTTTKSGKPFRIQQSTKLVDKDDRDHTSTKSPDVIILAANKAKQIAEWERNAGNGEDVETPNGNLTVTDFVETVYFPFVKKNLSRSTYDSHKGNWAYMKDHFNHTKTLKAYQPFMGTQLLTKLADEGYSANSVKNCRATASAIFAHALGTGYLRAADNSVDGRKAANPWAGVLKNIKCKRAKPTVAYTPQDIERMTAALETVTGREASSARTAQMLIMICFWAGLRTEEAAGLDWKDVNFDENRLHICQVFVSGQLELRTKTGEDRDVPMLKTLHHSLRLWHAAAGYPKSGFVFPNRVGEPVNINDISSRTIKKTLEKQGLEWSGLYACRRGFGTIFVEAGATLEQTAVAMGNSPQVVFDHYFKKKNSKLAEQGFEMLEEKLAGPHKPKLLTLGAHND